MRRYRRTAGSRCFRYCHLTRRPATSLAAASSASTSSAASTTPTAWRTIFLRLGRPLGFDGYRRVHDYARDVATSLSAEIADLGPFELLTKGDELPVFAFKLRDDVDNFTVFDVSNALRERGWQVPAYTFPANRTDLAALASCACVSPARSRKTRILSPSAWSAIAVSSRSIRPADLPL